MKHKRIIITEEKEVDKLIQYCITTGYASVDFESNGYPPPHPLFQPTILGVSFQPGISYIIPLAHKSSPFRKNNRWLGIFKRFCKAVIENPKIIKVAWNFKYEYNVFRKYGITPKGRLFDAMLAKYLLKEERPNDLKSNVALFIPKYAGYDLPKQPSKDATLEQLVNFWSNVELEQLSTYCALDCDLTLRLMIFFERLLINNNFYFLFRNMLMMAVRVLADSEWHGIPCDTTYLDLLVKDYSIKIDHVKTSLYNNPSVKTFENRLIKDRIKNEIFKIEDEIENLYKELGILKKKVKKGKDVPSRELGNLQRKINNREDKRDRFIAKDFKTKGELKLVEPINFASHKQMVEFLFNSKAGLKFDIVRYTIKDKKETKTPSTDESVLEELKPLDKSGFIESLLELRGLEKLYSTYIIGMRNKLSPAGCIHGSFLLHGTVTGRLSSANPNLQNIPRDTTSSDIKKMFIPPKGKVLLQLDYSQAELRVFAAVANETEMLRWFKEGKDIHLAVACDKNKWEYDWALAIYEKEDKNDPNFIPIKKERKYAKTINFGIVYGQTAKKLSLGMECSLEEAEIYLRQYAKRFPKIWKFISKQHKRVKEDGYVINLFGRKRRLGNIWSDDWGKMAEAQRQSVNAPIQGAASDYTLFSSILIWEKIQKGELPKDMVQAYTVHDSLGYFVNPEDVAWVVPILDKICSNPETKEWFNFQIDSVKMKVDFEISHENWGALSKYDPNKDYVELVNAA